jgi:hypothetical protein
MVKRGPVAVTKPKNAFRRTVGRILPAFNNEGINL